tara:strand:+ start:5156 stop:6499 length:1344 start_codon:yes stop_codon:yes gene_type:complete
MIPVHKEFSNGLKLVYEHNTDNITSVNLFVEVGSLNESPDLHGASHFIEHMLFKGTKKLPETKMISSVFDKIGAFINAHTFINYTCYVSKFESGYFDICFNTLVDMLLNSLFKRADFDLEKNVIVEEIKRQMDNTEAFISTKIYNLLFNNTDVGKSIGGTPDTVLNLEYQQVVDYYKYFYKPANIIVSICSNLSFDEIVNKIAVSELIKNDTSDIVYNYLPNYAITKNSIRNIRFFDRDLEQIHMSLGFKVCDMYNDDKYSLDILRIILSGNMSSILFSSLREKNGLTYNISIDNTLFKKYGIFAISTSVDRNKLLNFTNKGVINKGALEIIILELNKIIKNGITKEQLGIAKGYYKGILSLSLEDSSSITEFNGINVLYKFNESKIALKDLYNTVYADITLKNINSVINKYITGDNIYSYYVGPEKYITNDNINTIIRIEDSLIHA